ncbi:low density lipoprotein receptor adapter protein 1-like isoform X2 [Podarcis muralis]
MEALRAAGRAVLRSPSLARHRLGVARLRRHQLPESWSDMREPLLEGMGFALKYLGMTLVEKPKGEDMASAAIHRILATARVGPKKFRKVILTVSPRGLSLQDAETKETIETISIYRISYCTTDKLQNKVFAYVAQNPQSGALECHAFLSPKKKIAQAVTLTVAQAFQVALDLWEAAQAGGRRGGRGGGGGGRSQRSLLWVWGGLRLGAPQLPASSQWRPGAAAPPAAACLRGHFSEAASPHLSPATHRVFAAHLQHSLCCPLSVTHKDQLPPPLRTWSSLPRTLSSTPGQPLTLLAWGTPTAPCGAFSRGPQPQDLSCGGGVHQASSWCS